MSEPIVVGILSLLSSFIFAFVSIWQSLTNNSRLLEDTSFPFALMAESPFDVLMKLAL